MKKMNRYARKLLIISTILFIWSTSVSAATWYAIQGKLEKNSTGEWIIQTKKDKYLVQAKDLPDDGKKGLVKMLGKQVVATGTIYKEGHSVKIIQLKTFAEVLD